MVQLRKYNTKHKITDVFGEKSGSPKCADNSNLHHNKDNSLSDKSENGRDHDTYVSLSNSTDV